jgi:3-hydroxy-3-methylglutaryl CoA synthase/uncharacterized OB-fold protein
MGGLVAYGAYVPYHRLDRGRITAALGSGGGRGTRAVASYDEDTTSMAVEAGRAALAALPDRAAVKQVMLATTAPAYADKTNATAAHAALGLAPEALVLDLAGAVRSGVGALLLAAQSPVPTLALLSDTRTGLPGGADERDGGDGAAAFVFGGTGDLPVLAEVLAQASATGEFMDRWRTPGELASKVWEERFGESAFAGLADAAVADVLKDASLAPGQIDHLIVAGSHGRAVKRTIKAVGVRPEAIAPDHASAIGNAGAAQAGILLADVLDRAGAGETILLVVLADGATAVLLKTTPELAALRPSRTVPAQIAEGSAELPYATFLSWRGLLDREPPRRPDPTPIAAPPAHRRHDWKFGLVASKCTQCGTRSLPPARVCLECHAIDEVAPEPLTEVRATVATFTVDWLAFSPSPPVLVVVLDFDGGGRMRCQLTDATPDEVQIGMRVEMTFRRLTTAAGVHNYFWKARPVRAAHA